MGVGARVPIDREFLLNSPFPHSACPQPRAVPTFRVSARLGTRVSKGGFAKARVSKKSGMPIPPPFPTQAGDSELHKSNKHKQLVWQFFTSPFKMPSEWKSHPLGLEAGQVRWAVKRIPIRNFRTISGKVTDVRIHQAKCLIFLWLPSLQFPRLALTLNLPGAVSYSAPGFGFTHDFLPPTLGEKWPGGAQAHGARGPSRGSIFFPLPIYRPDWF
jgi:hypothetical protein